MSHNKEFTDKSRVFWSKRYGRPVTDGELDEIHRNLFGFYGLLLQFMQEDAAKKAAQDKPPATAESNHNQPNTNGSNEGNIMAGSINYEI